VRQAAALGLRLRPAVGATAALARHLDDPDALTAGWPPTPWRRSARLRCPNSAWRPPPRCGGRINAVRAMALLKDQAAIPDLFIALDDGSTVVRHWAERGLEDLGVGMVFFAP
jgi:HEAT repeat protein